MADPLARVSPGDPLRISAAAWNRLADMARLDRRPASPPPAGGRYGVVEALALNSTGADLREHKPAAVTAAGGYDLTADAGYDWQRRPLLTLGVPAAATDWVCVTLEAIPAGAVGRVAVAGTVLCDVKVNGSTHGYASPTTNTTALESAESGSVRILHKGTGSSTRRCAVYLGDQVAPAASFSPSYFSVVQGNLVFGWPPSGVWAYDSATQIVLGVTGAVWHVTLDVRYQLGNAAASDLACRLVTNPNPGLGTGVPIANTERLVGRSAAGVTTESARTCTWQVTVGGDGVLAVEFRRTGAGAWLATALLTDANGRSYLNAHRLSA